MPAAKTFLGMFLRAARDGRDRRHHDVVAGGTLTTLSGLARL